MSAQPNFNNHGKPESFEGLMYLKAVENLDIDELEYLSRRTSSAKRREYANQVTEENEPLITYAIRQQRTDILAHLLNDGANPFTENLSAFQVALSLENAPALMLLSQKPTSDVDDQYRLAELFQCSLPNYNAALSLPLIHLGLTDNERFTPLLSTVMFYNAIVELDDDPDISRKKQELIKIMSGLLAQGDDPNRCDDVGMTAREMAKHIAGETGDYAPQKIINAWALPNRLDPNPQSRPVGAGPWESFMPEAARAIKQFRLTPNKPPQP